MLQKKRKVLSIFKPEQVATLLKKGGNFSTATACKGQDWQHCNHHKDAMHSSNPSYDKCRLCTAFSLSLTLQKSTYLTENPKELNYSLLYLLLKAKASWSIDS